MSNNEDTTPFSTLWSAWASTTQANRDSAFQQIAGRLKDLPMPSVQAVLDMANSGMKKVVWNLWAKQTDLSGVQLGDVMGLLETEPLDAIYSIVTEWVAKVNLSHYDLRQINKAAGLLRGMDDKTKLWTRWLDSSKELATVNLVDFCEAISGYSPELQLSLINGFAKNAPNLGMYSTEERIKAKKHINAWAAVQCPIFNAVAAKVGVAKYNKGETVLCSSGLKGKIESVILNGGGWKYWLEGAWAYTPEAGIVGRVNL